MLSPKPDPHLFQAVLQVAKEECACATWDELAPVLEATWERLRQQDSADWSAVVDDVRASCVEAGYVRH